MQNLIERFFKQNSRLKNTDVLPEFIYESLPPLLKESCSKFVTAREKDVFLTSALTIMSGCLPNLKGMHDKDYYSPNLFALIVAPPASGKGVMKFAKCLGSKVHEKLLRDATLSLVNQNVENEKVTRKMLFIPANTSAAMFLNHLKENGGFGIMCESEADTLANSFKQEWGNFSDSLRAAFHHEPITYSRKQDKEYIEIPHPKLSLLITGTPLQIKTLIPSAENGLFSRNLFYLFASDNHWRNPKPCFNCNSDAAYFVEQGEKVLQMASFHSKNHIDFFLEDRHWEEANTYFTEASNEFSDLFGEEAVTVVRRLAIIQFRLAMILSAIRNYSNPNPKTERITCIDIDFQIALSLIKVYIKHSMLMLQLIPKSMAKEYGSRGEAFYDKLPNSFKRAEGIEIAAKEKIGERTADRYLQNFIKEKKTTSNGGFYQKI